MKNFKVNQFIILFVLISFAVAQEIKSAVPDNEKKLKLDCDDDSKISILIKNNTIWKNSFEVNCPNRSTWNTFGVLLFIGAKCQLKTNCSVDLSNITIANCTNFQQYLNVKYTCNITETTTEITTTEADLPDDDDDNSEEEKSTTTTTTTKKPPGRVEPHYIPHVVPGLLTTPHPTRRPHNLPVPLIPVPAPRPIPQLPRFFEGPGPFDNSPLFQHYPAQNLNFPLFLPLPAPVPIPIFG